MHFDASGNWLEWNQSCNQMEQTKNEDKSTVTEEQKQESTSVANQTSDVKQTNETNTPKVNPEKLRGLCVSKRPWKAPKTRLGF